jgi:hypothetical protein
VNGILVFDRTKSVSINKRMKRYNDNSYQQQLPVAGYISELDSKLFEDGLDTPFDFNEAVRRNLVILPDSVANLTQNVQSVLDLATNTRVDFEMACRMGIIDLKNRKFIDSRGNRHRSLSLFEALGKNYIVMRDELVNNYADENDEESGDDEDQNRPSGSNKSRKTALTLEDIASVFNPNTGEQCSLEHAIQIGLFDARRLVYIDDTAGKTSGGRAAKFRTVELEEAADKGLVLLKQTTSAGINRNNYKFLRIKVIWSFFIILK